MTCIHSHGTLALVFLLFASPVLAAPFTDNGNGTVTDDATGLVWDKCSWGQTWDSGGNTCSLSGDATAHAWAAALSVAVTANTDNHRGHGDWRLPNRTELVSLLDLSASAAPTIDPIFPHTPPDEYWSSTSYAPGPTLAWSVTFATGQSTNNNKTAAARVRLVRGGQSFGAFDDQAQAQDAAHVPTLTEWTLLLLAGMLALIGYGRMRRGVLPHRNS